MGPERILKAGPALSVLVVEDEPSVRDVVVAYLKASGHSLRAVGDGAAGLAALEVAPADVVITDLHMPVLDGLTMIRRMRAAGIASEVIIVSAFVDIPMAVAALHLGVCDIVQKPFGGARLLQAIEIAAGRLRLARSDAGRAALAAPPPAEALRFVGRSAAVERLIDVIAQVGPTESTVLIEGETGAGKEVLARALHAASPRAAGPFVPVNCGALPEGLVEAQLFGHAKGAFTGASEARPGFFRTAAGGTIFLDEIGDLPLGLQVKVLRALEERAVVPVGLARAVPADVRVIAASNRSLDAAAAAGGFRPDLLYRLKVVRIEVPPLRERREDIPLLVEHLIERLNARYGRRVRGAEPGALAKLLGYDFPGNVRELENVLERAFALGASETIRAEDLSDLEPAFGLPAADPRSPLDVLSSGGIPTLEEARRLLIERALEASGGNVERAAAILGVSAKTISRNRRRRDGT